jgi:mercuric ion binding protein
MKTIKICCLACVLLALATACFAQPKTETLKVSGECGTCKKKIEKAAKEAGASFAVWNVDTKILTVKYNSASTNTAKIEKKIADVGYDTPEFKASISAYQKLDKCCQYERESSGKTTMAMSCSATCAAKDGKCADEATCKAKGCCKDTADCKDASCCKKTE